MASLLPSTTSRTNRTMSASEPETTKTAEHPLENYAPAPGIFDEMQSAAKMRTPAEARRVFFRDGMTIFRHSHIGR